LSPGTAGAGLFERFRFSFYSITAGQLSKKYHNINETSPALHLERWTLSLTRTGPRVSSKIRVAKKRLD
jgi:hypothetical protein